jgi:uncharacterized membrane protein
MQNPPPGPPPGGQPVASSGIDKRTGSTLAYLVTWLTGIIFLFVGKNDPDVKYNAAQSVVLFGSLQVLQILLGILSNFVGFFSLIGLLVWLVYIILWLVCLFKAWTGNGARFEVPILGGVITPYAEQLANSVN